MNSVKKFLKITFAQVKYIMLVEPKYLIYFLKTV